ncbi:hypothetical protein [Paenibacillus sp. NEAU-GSW1]|uniref:hypothetical protein n=1 Tax=Paenibacillus sp. NEAU-GSW1 TaxID=2682486 RepID=UPI0012E0E13C|nr:hypothetical protein [Paenibacillus sp. NEAU-GSW1]MUT68514.1 hypothetical protein [Paenibacillus sp. NEAU-GSW1]
MDFLDFSSYDWNTWSTFLKEHWIVLAIALAVLLLIMRIVKTVLRWAFAAVIVVGIVLYSGYSMDDLKAIGAKVADNVKEEAVDAMVGEISNATFTTNSDGSFTVKTDNLTLTGKPGEREVSVSFRNTPLGTWKIDDTIQALIDQAKQNSKA